MNNKNIRDTFESFAPSEEQKGKIYESIINVQESKGEKVKLHFSAKLAYVLGACLILAAMAAALFSSPISSFEPDNTYRANMSSENSALPVPAENNSTFNGFMLTVYTVNDETAYLSANYAEETEKAVLTPDVKILLAKYDPAMSSVPGFPLTININGEDDIEAITVSADGGGLCKWDRDTGVVSPEGYTASIGIGETIYWSLIGSENVSNEKTITIIVEAVADHTVVGRQSIYITQDKPGYYYATVGEMELV